MAQSAQFVGGGGGGGGGPLLDGGGGGGERGGGLPLFVQKMDHNGSLLVIFAQSTKAGAGVGLR